MNDQAMPVRPIVAVIGPSQTDSRLLEQACQVGALIAQRGWILVTGGRGGVMEAASRGAAESGGIVLGILPGTDAVQANPHVQIPIVTGLSEARNAVIALTSAAIVAVGKGYGTLAEIAFALKLGRPVASLGSWEIDPAMHVVATPEEAVTWVAQAMRPGASRIEGRGKG